MNMCEPSYRTLPIDEAFAYAETLTEFRQETSGSLQVFAGIHHDDGKVYVLIPPLGDAVILPR